jgi:hypothetical protein
MKKIARSLRQHRELILNYFLAQKQLSSGVVEGLNNKAKLTMRKSAPLRKVQLAFSGQRQSGAAMIDSRDEVLGSAETE